MASQLRHVRLARSVVGRGLVRLVSRYPGRASGGERCGARVDPAAQDRTRGLRVARCWLGSASFLTCGALMFASTIVASPVLKATLLAFALGSADLALSACWAVPLDIGAEHAGVITGFMNTFGNLGGLL